MVRNIYPSGLESATYLIQWEELSISSIFYTLTAFVLLKNLHIVLLAPCLKKNNTTMEMVVSLPAINTQTKNYAIAINQLKIFLSARKTYWVFLLEFKVQQQIHVVHIKQPQFSFALHSTFHFDLLFSVQYT